jgi:hypothetical protein
MAEVAAAADDDGIRLLRALITDVDADAPPLPAGARTAGPAGSKPYRRRTRIFVSFGVAAMVLTSTGVAAAGGTGGAGSAISGFVQPADDRPNLESRAESRRVHEAVDRREYRTARTSRDGTRDRRPAVRAPRAPAGDNQIDRVESRPRNAPPPPLPRLEEISPPPPAPESAEPPRNARAEAEDQLDEIRDQWAGR